MALPRPENPALLKALSAAFGERCRPEVLVGSDQLSKDELAEVMAFSGRHWSEVTCDLLEENRDALFWFSPEAFCFYLPGVLSCGIAEDRPDLLAYDAILGMLDRSPEPAYWDDFFLARWPLLSAEECEACQSWLRWLDSAGAELRREGSVFRALETLDLLKTLEGGPQSRPN